ncbi:hypothetical protein U3516DRAFT_772879 [Neocallimastix sp. 'constans']
MKSIALLTFILFVRITYKTKEFCLYNLEEEIWYMQKPLKNMINSYDQLGMVGNNAILDSYYKKLSENYIISIYNKLKNLKKRCIPSMIINPGVDAANVRYALGSIINIDKNIFNDIPFGINKCSAVNSCKGCNVVYNDIITEIIEKYCILRNKNNRKKENELRREEIYPCEVMYLCLIAEEL